MSNFWKLFRMNSNYQEMQADLQCLANQQSQLQHNSLQTEMLLQHYPGIQSLQQVYQSSHPVHQPQNYLMNLQQNNNSGMPNRQMMQKIEHNNTENDQQWHSLMNEPPLTVFNNYQPAHTQYQHQPYVNNKRSVSNTLPNSSNAFPTIDNHYLPQEPYDHIMQPNKETQSQQFFLHNNQQHQQTFRKSWDITSMPQTNTFAEESQNVWNGR